MEAHLPLRLWAHPHVQSCLPGKCFVLASDRSDCALVLHPRATVACLVLDGRPTDQREAIKMLGTSAVPSVQLVRDKQGDACWYPLADSHPDSPIEPSAAAKLVGESQMRPNTELASHIVESICSYYARQVPRRCLLWTAVLRSPIAEPVTTSRQHLSLLDAAQVREPSIQGFLSILEKTFPRSDLYLYELLQNAVDDGASRVGFEVCALRVVALTVALTEWYRLRCMG